MNEGRMRRSEALTWAGALAVALATPVVFGAQRHVLATADLCSLVIPNPYLRSEHETYFIGSARPDTVQVRIPDVPALLKPWVRYPYRDSTPAFGQVVHVQSVYGADAERVLARFGTGDSTVVVIQYTNNSMCQTFPVRAWLETGVINHYAVFVRPDSEWAAGRPTFDIEMLSRLAVYPAYLRRTPGVNLDTTLTIDEYASLVKVLPVEPDWLQDCRKGLARIETWAGMHERTSETYPANDALRVMRWHCGVLREKH